MGKTFLFAAAAALCVVAAGAPPALVSKAEAQTVSERAAFDPGRAPFPITLAGNPVPYDTFFASVVPGGSLTVALGDSASDGRYTLAEAEAGEAAFVNGAATWQAPDAPGETRQLQVIRADGATIDLAVFILQPRGNMEGDSLNGYRIGAYPDEPLRGLEAYLPPEGFIEVTQSNRDMKVSPHFTLGQFLCKQQEDHWPKYVLIDPKLILKMEALLEDVNEQGIRTDTFFVMSGYRTPWYNRAIGNTTTYSQHVFGGAADIFIDVDGNGEMDDLNGDGRVNAEDARWLLNRAAALEARDDHADLIGGLGVYERNSVRGPFLHVDSRGYSARW